MTPFRENLRGIAATVLSTLLFLINDTMVKLVSDSLPLGQILFVRGLVSVMFLTGLAAWMGHFVFFRELFTWRVLVRSLCEIGGALFFLTALFHIPIGNINSILQVVPLMITAAGAIFLREHVGWRRWTAIMVGFLGVLVIVRPGLEGFNSYSLIALCAMFFITLRDMITRSMPRGVPAVLIALAASVFSSAAGAAWGLGEDWVAIEGRPALLMLGSSLFLIGGYLASIHAMQHGDIAVVSPFRYSVVIFAIIVGMIVWGEYPDALMLVGTALIIGTGIYTFYRERRLARARAA
jgi:drug/metabolite transporter (DMT)-like permease